MKKTMKNRRPRITVVKKLGWIRELAKELEEDATQARKNHKKIEISQANANALLIHVADVIAATCGLTDLPASTYIVGKVLKHV